jgi:hypothetical protein
MKTFLEFYQQSLDEKLILYNNDANYGQIVFFAGGAGSGKGFSISNFINKNKFKIRDVDELKLKMMQMPSIKRKYPEISSFSLKNPEDVAKLHSIAKKERIPDKQLMSWISGMKYPETLPNILFDITMKDLSQIDKYVPLLISVGYKPENIHITWVLANYSVAVIRNRNRERVVPEDILLQTHTGAATTIGKLLNLNTLPHNINGSVTVILNNPDEVTFYEKQSAGGQVLSLVKDFTYLTLKKSGRPLINIKELDKQVKEKLFRWVSENAPRVKEIAKLFK